MSVPPAGTVTFLFTDIEGSTRLWEEYPAAMRIALARHDLLVRETVEHYGGYVFKTLGDSFCTAFPSATAAVSAALAVRQALQDETWDAIGRLRVRIALHTGPAETRGGDYFGPALSRVTRLMSAGQGGQILLSGTTAQRVQNQLPAAVTLRDLGEYRLKDLVRPERIFQLVTPDHPDDIRPLRALEAFAHNLPIQVTSFIGREHEMADVIRLLAGTHLLTLTGPGGTGKTRLSLQVAADLLDDFADGVWLVELAALTDPALVGQAVASALGVREEAGRPLEPSLIAYLRAKHLLLVLDNCEHLIAACAQLAETLLLSCAGLRILASSREPLGIAGETTLRLPPLSFPDPNRLPAAAETLAAAQAAPAVQLFVDRASAVRPGFRLTEENAPTLIQICARLDGIPLALELAAARVSSLAVDVLAARLDDRFRLLTGGRRTALPRQQTLRALIDWSHTLLTADERVLFRRLAVFSGGWTLEAAEAVCDDGGWGLGAGGWDGSADPQPPIQNPQIPTPPIPNPPPPTPHPQLDILDLLIQLTNKSLIVVEEGEDATRYRLLETIRQYADEKLGDAGEAAAVRQRHRDWFLHFAETAAQQLQGAAQIAWMARLELEHDNLRAALAWCLTAPAGLQPGLRLAGALASFWGLRGYWHEGRHWLTSFLTHPGAAAPTAARAGALLGIATLTSDTTNSRRPLVESIAICRQLGDQPRLARALAHQGYVALNSGDYAEARALLRESQDLFRQTDDQRGLAECLYLLGRIALDQAQVPAAAALLEEGLARYRAAGDHEGLSACLLQLGRTLMLQGAYEAARGRFEESLALRRELGNWNGVLWALNNLGEAARAQGDYARAGTLYAESLQQAHAVGNKWGEAAVLHNLAYVALAAGDVPRARTYFADSLALADELGRKPGVAESLVGLGGVALAEHQPERALRLFAAADTLLAALGAHLDPPDQAEYDRHLRTVAAMLDSAAAARARAVGAGMPLAQAIAYALEG